MKILTMTSLRPVAIACILSLATACENMSTAQQRTLSGAAIGTGVGAAAAGMTGGKVGTGALLGAGAGAAGGYLYDQSKRKNR